MERISVVMPVRNCWHYLQETLEPVLEAVREYGNAELVLVDNGSTDGTYETLVEHFGSAAEVCRLPEGTISAVRNFGASRASGETLCFLDADCLVRGGYLHEVRRVFRETGAEAVGCRYDIPASPHWIEATWHALHADRTDRFVHFLPAGSLAVRAEAFRRVGGFEEALITGEDAELCQRLLGQGFRIYSAQSLSVVHLGNPKSVGRFYRRDVWHSLGMFGTVSWRSIDRPTAMMAFHLLATVAALVAVATLPLPLWGGLALLLLSQVAVPALTVGYRLAARRGGRRRSALSAPLLGRAVFLYWVYYWARVDALQIIARGREAAYRK